MAVRIRLRRMGSKRRPFYRFVVVDSRDKRDGKFLDQVGHYNPIVTPHEFKVDEEKVFDWLKKGAGLSDGARDLLRKHGTLRKWDAVRRGLPIPPDPVKIVEIKAPEPEKVKEPEPAEQAEPVEAEKPAEAVEAEKPAETAEPAEAVEAEKPAEAAESAEAAEAEKPAEAAEPAEASDAPETPEKPE